MELRIMLVLWICIYLQISEVHLTEYTGINIGYSCKNDAECIAGNGGEYSKCNQDLNICICTVNHLGEDKCKFDSDEYDGVCRRQTLYRGPGICTLECSPKGTTKVHENQDWYGDVVILFAQMILDRKTHVCYDPRRALNTVPEGFQIKQSSIPKAGLGVFTNIYIAQDTMFGPYKGIFESDSDSADASGYSWRINPRNGEERADAVWVDAKYVALSNWLRYFNTPISAAMENIVAIQHKGKIYYQAFRSIEPGTELLIWYGEAYGEFLRIEKFDSPKYFNANHGYVGGSCEEEEEGHHCLHDKNTVCADKSCFCLPGTNVREGMCIYDETLGGRCEGSDGETCKRDKNAECQSGVCACKSKTTPANGVCLPDETFGGRCTKKNGERCLLDSNTECVYGLCRCKYGTTGIGGNCVIDEAYNGRCIGNNGEACELDPNAECWESLCICKNHASEKDGKCELDGTLGGKCEPNSNLLCKLEDQTICHAGICICKKGTTNVNGTCISDGTLRGRCIGGKCHGQNMVCDTESNTCICQHPKFHDDDKCVKE